MWINVGSYSIDCNLWCKHLPGEFDFPSNSFQTAEIVSSWELNWKFIRRKLSRESLKFSRSSQQTLWQNVERGTVMNI